MDENYITCEREFEESEMEECESANLGKWIWVAAGSVTAAIIGGAVMFVKNRFGKKRFEYSDEETEIEVTDEGSEHEDEGEED